MIGECDHNVERVTADANLNRSLRICCHLFNGVVHYRTHPADVFRSDLPLLRLIDEKIIKRFGCQRPSMATQAQLTITPRTGQKESIEGDRRDYSHSDLGIRKLMRPFWKRLVKFRED